MSRHAAEKSYRHAGLSHGAPRLPIVTTNAVSRIAQVPMAAAVAAFFVARIARYPSSTLRLLANGAARRPRTAAQFFDAKNMSSDPVAIQTEESDRCTNLQTCREHQSRAPRFTRRESISSLELKHVEHFEDDDNNDNDPNDVEDVSVHGSWVTRRYPQRQAIYSSRVISVFPHVWRCLGSS